MTPDERTPTSPLQRYPFKSFSWLLSKAHGTFQSDYQRSGGAVGVPSFCVTRRSAVWVSPYTGRSIDGLSAVKYFGPDSVMYKQSSWRTPNSP